MKPPTRTEEQKLATYAEQLKAKYGVNIVLEKYWDDTAKEYKVGHRWFPDAINKINLIDQTLDRLISTGVSKNKLKGIKLISGAFASSTAWEETNSEEMEVTLYPAVFDPEQRAPFPSYIKKDKKGNEVDESAAISIMHGVLHVLNPSDVNSPYFDSEKGKSFLQCLFKDGVIYWEIATDNPGGLPKDFKDIVWLKEPRKVGRGLITDIGNLPPSYKEFYPGIGVAEIFTQLGYNGDNLRLTIEKNKMPNTAKIIADDLFSR